MVAAANRSAVSATETESQVVHPKIDLGPNSSQLPNLLSFVALARGWVARA